MAIDGERGLFRGRFQRPEVMYTRNGEFSVNKDGYMTNPQGYFLTGFVGDSTTPERIRVPYGNIAPQATDTVTLQANFDANADAVPSGQVGNVGWIDMVPDGSPAGTPAERFYFMYQRQADGTSVAKWTDIEGNLLQAGDAGFPAAATYRSGPTSTVTVAADGSIGPIPATAASETFTVRTGGERIGELSLGTDSADPATFKTYYYRMVSGQLVWTNALGEQNDTDATLRPAAGTHYSSSGQSVDFLANGDLATGANVPEDAYSLTYLPAQQKFDPLVPGSYTHSLPMTVYDSLGNSHQLTQYFVKREANPGESVWNVYYRLDGEPIQEALFDGTHELVFDAAGRLTYPNTPQSLSFGLGGGDSPAETLTLTLDYAGSTQFGGGFTPDFVQNGYSTGEYASLGFAADGSIVANYTNGEMMKTGTIALSSLQ